MNPVYVCERVAEFHRQEWLRGGPADLKHLLLHGAVGEGRKTREERERERRWLGLFPSPSGGLDAVMPLNGWSHIEIPGEFLQ